MTDVEMVGWHHRFNGHEFEQTPGDGEGQGSLVSYSPCGHKELGMTVRLNNCNKPPGQWYCYGNLNSWDFGPMQKSSLTFVICCCCCSVAKSRPTLCDPVDCSTPGFPVLHHLLEFAQTHVH